MPSPKSLLFTAATLAALVSSAFAVDFGRAPSAEELRLWSIDVLPNGRGLPVGSGTVSEGRAVYADNCAACHGDNGADGVKDRLVGGRGSLTTSAPLKTVGSFWPYSTTLFDYVQRAMPYQAPGSLSVNDTYAVVAYLLGLNGILPTDGRLDQDSLPQVRMPNRDGFIPEPEFRAIGNSR